MANNRQPDGKIRRSQMVTGYGPGAMVDLIDHAVMVDGLDTWSREGSREISEPRLLGRLQYLFQSLHGRRLEKLWTPPIGDDDNPSGQGVRVLRFPEFYVCAGCRTLVHYRNLNPRTKTSSILVHSCAATRSKSPPSVPVRFVAACPKGHIQDFPWRVFVHEGAVCSAPELFLDEGETGDFSGIWVRCRSCGAHRSLKSAYAEQAMPVCKGRRPWLIGTKEETSEPNCEHRLRLLVRTASNAYFSQTMTALSIPEDEPPVVKAVARLWNTYLSGIQSTEQLAALRGLPLPLVTTTLDGFTAEEILDALSNRRAGRATPRPPIRVAEFATLTAQPFEQPGEYAGGLGDEDEPDFFARRIDVGAPSQIQQVVVASRLREVRAQVGFTRLDAFTPNLEGEFDLAIESAPLSLSQNWLPAVEIWGEGIFLALNEELLRAWELRPQVVARGDLLRTAFENAGRKDFPGVRFYMMHSLAHLLITALSLECGYAASAIRERIYCNLPGADAPMAGILLSTGTPGSEGTLGGLVQEGRNIARHLDAALRLGSLCSSDPVCASQVAGMGNRHLEGAACHGCLYIAESSCEWFNRFLDRALVVPVIGQPDGLAFFARQ